MVIMRKARVWAVKREGCGQVGFEFLTIYGWVFLIIVIVLSSMWSMGLNDPQAFTKKGCIRFNNLGYKDHRFSYSGDFLLKLSNDVGETVKIKNFTVVLTDFYYLANTTEFSALPGDDVNLVTFGGPQNLAKHTSKYYTVNVRVDYSVPASLSGHFETATCTGKFQPR